jgi:peptide/nickel transport system ATP-binding protein/oligopeptide transport system ATP-binding protein
LNQEELLQVRKKTQLIFQDPYASLNPRKTIRDNIGESLIYHGLVRNRGEQSDKVEGILQQIGLPPSAMMRYPHQFSGGQQQRICIGRALALTPSLIVCDEALSALDVSIQAQMLNLLQELKQKFSLSYVFISHDLSCVHYLADQVIVLYLGKVMEKASAQELFQNPRHPYTQALISSIPKSHPREEKKRIQLKGEIPSAAHPPSGCPFRTRCPYAQPICALPPPHKIIKDRKTGQSDHEYYCILD